MPATVLLIRHPESAWNRQGVYQGQKDIPLSPLGLMQAELVASRLSSESITGVICSPLKRAWDLANAIAQRHGLDPRIDDRLIEIAHGPWEGLTRHEVAAHFPDLYREWLDAPHTVTFPDGESLHDVHDRSLEPVIELLARPAGETWVVVTHDTVARLVVAAAQQKGVAGFSEVELENAGITTLQGPHLVGSVKHLNDVAHLGEHRVDLEGQAL